MSLLQRLKNKAQTPSYQEARLEVLKAKISTLPEGKVLLQLASDLNCPIEMEGYPLFSAKMGRYDSGDFTKSPAERGHGINLDSNQGDTQLAAVLLHELRHLWQLTTISNAEKIDKLSLSARIAFTRAVEGDAWVFEKMMMQKLKYQKTPSPKKWTEAFDGFQKSNLAANYDFRTIKNRRRDVDERGTAAEGSIHTLDAFNLKDIFKAGINGGAPDYMAPTLAKRIKPTLMANVRPFEIDMAKRYYRQLRRAKTAARF